MTQNQPQPMASDIQDPTPVDFHYRCPQCDHRLTEYANICPQCGADLDELHSVTYRRPISTVGRIIALIILVGLTVPIILALAVLLFQALTSSPT